MTKDKTRLRGLSVNESGTSRVGNRQPASPNPAFATAPDHPHTPSVKALNFLPLLCALLLPLSGQGAAVIREEGAIYLEDLLAKPVKLATIEDAPCFWKIDRQKFLGTLRKGQLVEVQAVSEGAYRVRGQAQQGQVLGWVEPKYLSPLKPEFLENLKQNAARLAEVEALIARNEVAVNMTPEEVTRALGKPSKKTSRLDAAGREEVWEFVRFERVPQEVTSFDKYGRLVTNFIYVKVPAGRLSVTFRNNLTASLEQSEGTLLRDARVRIVSVPFQLFY
jgi:hypothetical protein